MTDLFLIRFCRARKFVFDDVKIMFDNYMKYRNDNKIDFITSETYATQE